MCSYTRLHIFEIWCTMNGNESTKANLVYNAVVNNIENQEFEVAFDNLQKNINYICKKCAELWKKHQRTKSRVLQFCSDWLKVSEIIVLYCDEKMPSTSNKRGRPQKDYLLSSKRTKQRKLADLNKNNQTMDTVLRNTFIKQKIPYGTTANENDVLSLIMETNLSKRQYLVIKDFINAKLSFNMLPSYKKILNAKKKCYPKTESTTVTESHAEVELQDLLNLTASRILNLQTEVLQHESNKSLKNLVLLGKWGFDGSTGHSEYKQKFENNNTHDNSLFVTSYVPLQLISEVNVSEEPVIIWKNPRPSSTKFCRPIRFQFKKETTELTIDEERYYKRKIEALQSTEFEICNRKFYVKHNLQLTMVDGKVCNALSGMSSTKCYICEATPKEMNKIDNCLEKKVHIERYEFGLSPLHAWIRFFEYFIHLSYRMDFKKWQIRSTEEKIKFQERKTYIQTQFREKLGLLIDKPKVGGCGNSNDGNTARTFFNNLDVSAEITGIDKNLMERCCSLLQALSCGYKIDVEKFRDYALVTARGLVAKYGWYYLPATVHKILIHAPEVIENALLSIGELSEEAAEAKNKDIKNFRLNHTRKMSRVVTNIDLLHILLLSSDPILSSSRKVYYKKKTILLKSALSLLAEIQ